MEASFTSGNREQIENGKDGILCPLTARGIADSIKELIGDEEKRKRIKNAAEKDFLLPREEENPPQGPLPQSFSPAYAVYLPLLTHTTLP